MSSATLFPSRFRTLRLEIRLGKRFHEWANRRRSFSPVQSRRVSPGVRATRQSREPGSARRRRAKKKPCGGGEGEDKWPGRGSPLKRSSGVSSVEARVAQGAQRPLPSPPTPAPLVLVSSWKSIAGKRVKIHPCPRKNLTQGWTGSAGGGLKSEKEGKGWRGKEREGEGRRGRERVEEVEVARPRWNEIYIPRRGAAYSFREPLVSRNLPRLRDPRFYRAQTSPVVSGEKLDWNGTSSNRYKLDGLEFWRV